jgi:hypothetical protein
MTSEISTTHFPHAVLTPLANSRPSAATLELLQQELSANAIAIPSARGNGTLGHYALVVDAATYTAAANNTPFIAPIFPGAAPIHAAAATGAQITETNRQFLADQREYTIYKTTKAMLKRQVLEAVPATFTNSLKDKTLGFANVATLEILTRLHEDYGTITTDDLYRNMQRLHKEWSPSQPIEDLFEQIRQCRDFASVDDLISESTAVRAGLLNIEKTGLFEDAIRDWRKRADATKTLANFMTDFRAADAERHRKLTTTTAGYHSSAANVEQITAAMPTALAITAPTTTAPIQLYYCWSHGAGRNRLHTSVTCNSPQPGHRTEATIHNMCGGCNLVHRQRNEKPVYVAPVKPAASTTNTTA